MYYIRCIGAQRPYSPGSSDLLSLVRSVLDDGDNGIQGSGELWDLGIRGSDELQNVDPRDLKGS
jgi:hypothetical protein